MLLMEALAEGPRPAKELDRLAGLHGRLNDATRYFNELHKRIGSHWRVRGVRRPGQKYAYALVMEG